MAKLIGFHLSMQSSGRSLLGLRSLYGGAYLLILIKNNKRLCWGEGMELGNFQGIGVGNNSAWGKTVVIARPKFPASTKSALAPAEETKRLREAIAVVSLQLEATANEVDDQSAEILRALQLMVQDSALLAEAEREILSGWTSETSIQKAMEVFTESLSGVPTFEDRIVDLQDLALRVVGVLSNTPWTLELPAVGPIVVVAEDLLPSETAQFTDAVVAVITSGGGPTSHTAIICRQKNIPALVAVKDALQIGDGVGIIVDAPNGTATLSDVPVELDAKQTTRIPKGQLLVPVRGNIGTIHDAKALAKTQASGVGLMRTEFMFLSRNAAPTISEQTELYVETLNAAPTGEFIFRTFDSASDKPLSFVERNRSEVLENQLQAIANAQEITGRNVSVMAPMLSSVSQVKEFEKKARATGIDTVGVMVETVDLAGAISELGGIVDFVSIGTNDLSRDLFQADRVNANFASLADPWQPDLLKMIQRIVSQATLVGITVGVCGEAAADPVLAIALVGLGVQSLSMAAPSVGQAIEYLSSVTMDEAKAVARSALSGKSVLEAKQLALAVLPNWPLDKLG
jgi:phosphotransferase system enzyme I (PtsI)